MKVYEIPVNLKVKKSEKPFPKIGSYQYWVLNFNANLPNYKPKVWTAEDHAAQMKYERLNDEYHKLVFAGKVLSDGSVIDPYTVCSADDPERLKGFIKFMFANGKLNKYNIDEYYVSFKYVTGADKVTPLRSTQGLKTYIKFIDHIKVPTK
jgi:hypothetical protein